jgi:hypothetical protein
MAVTNKSQNMLTWVAANQSQDKTTQVAANESEERTVWSAADQLHDIPHNFEPDQPETFIKLKLQARPIKQQVHTDLTPAHSSPNTWNLNK